MGSGVGRRWRCHRHSMCVSGYAGIGMSCMKRLKRVGESTDPRGLFSKCVRAN